ncbi:chitin deacetylase [Polyrhizophydium stewartii]|uniref:Chitin deacetylase n=1 Tax=Polyrhizophydium stewartii TaxID=2732419 RepID=A0ABR4NFN6_9FUNG
MRHPTLASLATPVAALLSAAAAQTQPPAALYPALDKAPAAVAQWSQLLTGKTIPALPLNTAQLPSPVWTSYVTACSEAATIAMTYDDGPSTPTPALLDELKKRNIKVTFFVVGSRVVERPEVLKRAYDEGHQIAVHTWSHPALTTVSSEVIVAELLFTARIIQSVIGVTPKYMRPPYGDIDERVGAVINALGFIPIIWSFDSEDSAGATNVADRFKTLVSGTKTGQIALEHDLTAAEASQAPASLDAVIAGGYKIVRVDQCVGQPAYDEGLWGSLPRDGILAPVAAGVTTNTSSSTTTTAVKVTSSTTTSASLTSSLPPSQTNKLTGEKPAPPPMGSSGGRGTGALPSSNSAWRDAVTGLLNLLPVAAVAMAAL